ncbi:hypothetical protein [Oryzifoliimicrobium ureilyticus]|uniref:hypothetical protein n=1 Tax=Oryzifoliimicrobium ureilyticus TaxID=3113724 RepID=UPI003075F0A2
MKTVFLCLRWGSLIALVIGSVLWYADKRRGAAFEAATFRLCEPAQCLDLGSQPSAEYRASKRSAVQIWPRRNYCDDAKFILVHTALDAEARFIPSVLEAEGVITLKTSKDGVAISPGPEIAGLFAPVRALLTKGGASSCFNSNYEPWMFVLFLCTLALWSLPNHRILRKRSSL